MSTLESRIVHCRQGSIEWFEARCGRVTGSDVAQALAIAKIGANKGGDTEARKGYKASIISELLTGEPDMEGYVTGPMNRGSDEEPLARAAYEVATDLDVKNIGFVIHPTIERAGSSPDGLVGTDGCLELKAPKSKTHIKYMLSGELPDEYEPQVMFELATTEREWCDFVSYDSRMPSGLQIFCKRIYRNEPRITEINNGVIRFLEEVDEVIYRLNKLRTEPPPPPKPQEIDPELGITDEDFPDWYHNMKASTP